MPSGRSLGDTHSADVMAKKKKLAAAAALTNEQALKVLTCAVLVLIIHVAMCPLPRNGKLPERISLLTMLHRGC